MLLDGLVAALTCLQLAEKSHRLKKAAKMPYIFGPIFGPQDRQDSRYQALSCHRRCASTLSRK